MGTSREVISELRHLILTNMASAPTPVHFFSHGSTMMLGEESESADYWKKAGDEALAHDIKGVIMMVCPPLLTQSRSAPQF